MKKNVFTKFRITAAILVLFATVNLSAAEVGIGGALGLRTYQTEDGLFASPQIEGNVFIDGEKFGMKIFLDFSFNSSETSTFNNTNTAVTYNLKRDATKEGIGLAPYYFFKNNENFKIYAGPSLSLNFYQTQQKYDYTSAATADIKTENNYLLVNLGLFLGAKYSVSEKLDVIFELPLETKLLQTNFTYRYSGTEMKNYQNSSFGCGANTGSRVSVTPKLGIVYKL